MDSFETRLVEAVRRKRVAEGLSLRGLSSVVGVSFSTLARIERGDGLPDNNSKIRLLEWLGPAAEEEGLSYENVALVHFRAGKNARSQTVRALLAAADCLKRQSRWSDQTSPVHTNEPSPVSLSKEELESVAEKLRNDLELTDGQPLDPLLLEIQGVDILRLSSTDCLDKATVAQLSAESRDEWSAMSVPLDSDHEYWAVLLNDFHTIERQRVTLLEEIWHIFLGHKLTKIAKVAEAYGRTYDSTEEHDAYYLASATLLPRAAIASAISERRSSIQIARYFGTSSELVDYRIKRLGLWRDHIGKKVSLVL
jgi:transcriptional regulator with XRE-family HTH domain